MKARWNRLSLLGSTGLLLGMLLWAESALALDSEGSAAVAAIAGTMLLFAMAIGLAFYIYVALALQTIAKKTGTPNDWLAWIPIANIILMLNIAKKELWWFILCLIPLVNIVIFIIIWMGIAEARHKPNWWGILMIVPLVGLVVPGYLAWAD